MKPSAPLRRYKRMPRGKALIRRTPMPRDKYKPAVPVDVRAQLVERSGGLCEIRLPGCHGRGLDPAHRITQKAGGRHGAARLRHDRLSNVIFSCRSCHDWCEDNNTWAHDLGLVLREWQDPTAEPAFLYRYGRTPSYLTDDGRVVPFEEACA
jgi:hypothetical protein